MKKNRKAIVITICLFLFVIFILYVVVGLFGTFELGEGVCLGGYITDLYNSQISSIEKVLSEELDDIVRGQIHYNLSYKGREMRTEFVDKNGKIVKLTGTLYWYWSKEVEWKVVQ